MFVRVRGLKVYYETVGSGSPVLLLHGWGTDSTSMRPVLSSLKETLGARALSLDFPGFGLSETPAEAWSVSDYVSVVAEFIDQLALGKIDIIAHSFGGRVAIKLAAGQPQRVRRLVLVDSAGIRPPRSAAYYLKVCFAKLMKLGASILPDRLRTPSLKRIVDRHGSTDYREAGDLRRTFVKVVNEDLRQYLHLIQCPTLLIWGELDEDTPLRDAYLMRDLIPGASLQVLEGAGHFSYLDRLPAFSKSVASFLGGESLCRS